MILKKKLRLAPLLLMFASITMMAQNPSTQTIKILTSDEQIHLNDNNIRKLSPEMFSGLTHLAILGIKGLPGFKRTPAHEIKTQLHLPANIQFW